MAFSRRQTCSLGVSMALAALLGSGAGCSGGGNGGAGGAGGSGNTGGTGYPGDGPLAGRCDDLATRIGGFTVSLIEAMASNPAHTTFNGGARDRARPSDIWTQDGTTMDGCRLMVGPSYGCTPGCATGQVCSGPNQCIEDPRYQSAGTLTLVGLGTSAITIPPIAPTVPQYSWSAPSSMPLAHPPFTPGANVGLSSTGGVIPALMLDGRGIQPLAAGNMNAMFIKGEPFTFTWTAPAQAGEARIYAGLDIAHHGSVAAHIECDLPDTGTATIPAPLLSALIDKGLFGFPELTIARATYDSAMTSEGCVDFGVVSSVARPLIGCTAPGACKKSCTMDSECTAPETCLPGLVCGT
jgi:hypothetical protein